MKMNQTAKLALIPAAALMISACGDNLPAESSAKAAPAKPATAAAVKTEPAATAPTENVIQAKTAETESSGNYSLEFLHVNDVHSYIDPVSMSLRVPEGLVRVKAGGPEALKSIIEETRRRNPDVLLISAGDQITGNASNYDNFHGEADAVVHGVFGTDYYMLGNHEFDHGGKGIAQYMDYMKKLSPQSVMINSDLTVGKDSPVKDTGIPQVIRKINGRNVAFYAVTAANKILKSSSPDPDMSFKDTVPLINAMTAEKASKADIHVLISHQGILDDRINSAKFNDIDIIIGGDSHSLCGDFRAGGIKGECVYPMTRKNASGNKICVVQAFEYGKLIGDLKVTFDEKGNVTECSGSPILPLWSATATLKGDNVTAEAQKAAAARIKEIISAEDNPFVEASPNAEMTKALEPYRNKIRENFKYLGRATQDLCTTRYPTDNCLIKDTPNPYGSETCKAFGRMYLDGTGASVYLGNSGMYRVDLEQGDFTDLELMAITPFNNEIVEIELTGTELIEVLNQVVSYVNDDITSRDGGIPCGYGFSYAINNTATPVVSDVMIVGDDGKAAPVVKDGKYRILTTDYVLKGKDGFKKLKGKEVLRKYGSDANLVRQYLKKHEIIPVIPHDLKTITSFRDTDTNKKKQ